MSLKDDVLEQMAFKFENGSKNLYLGDQLLGAVVSRGKRVGIKQRLATEYMFRRNEKIGINEEQFGATYGSLKTKVAGLVAKHIKDGLMEIPKTPVIHNVELNSAETMPKLK